MGSVISVWEILNRGDDFIKNFLKSVFKEIVRYSIGVLALVMISLVVGLIISKIFTIKLSNVYQVIGVIIMAIGVLSIIGTKTVMISHSYSLSKHVIGGNLVTREDIKMLFQGQRFSIFTGISGLIIVLIGWVV